MQVASSRKGVRVFNWGEIRETKMSADAAARMGKQDATTTADFLRRLSVADAKVLLERTRCVKR